MVVLSAVAVLSAGVVVGGALGGLFLILNIITNIGRRFGVQSRIWILHMAVALGALTASVMYLSELSFGLGNTAATICIAFAGMFGGIIVGALAETLDVFPVGMHRMKIGSLVKVMVIVLLVGKTVSTLCYFLLMGG